MDSNIIGGMSFGMLLFYLINYVRLNGKEIGFPLYIYFAMFPFKLRELPIFRFDDLILKNILIFGIILMLIKSRDIKINKYELFFLIVVIIGNIIAYINNDNKMNLVLTGIFNIIFIFLFTFYFKNIVKTHEGIRLVFKIVIINALVLSIMALIESIIFQELRASVSMNNPNYLGFYLNIAFCLAAYSMKKVNLNSVLKLLVITMGIFTTGSFSAIFGMMLCLFFYIFFRNINTKLHSSLTYLYYVLFFVLTVGVIAIGSSDNAMTNQLVGTILSQKDSVRLYVWKNAIKIWKENIFFGIGYNQFYFDFNDYSYVTHNDYLRVLVETGIFGVTVLFWYFIVIIKKMISSLRNEFILYLSIFNSILIFSMFHNNMNSLLFWTMLALPFYDHIIAEKIPK